MLDGKNFAGQPVLAHWVVNFPFSNEFGLGIWKNGWKSEGIVLVIS